MAVQVKRADTRPDRWSPRTRPRRPHVKHFAPGWRWCPDAGGKCPCCRVVAEGLWRYQATPKTSTASICDSCRSRITTVRAKREPGRAAA